MRARTRLTVDEIKFLTELERHAVPFMIIGVGAAALQGAPIVTQDIDFWFKDPYGYEVRATPPPRPGPSANDA